MWSWIGFSEYILIKKNINAINNKEIPKGIDNYKNIVEKIM